MQSTCFAPPGGEATFNPPCIPRHHMATWLTRYSQPDARALHVRACCSLRWGLGSVFLTLARPAASSVAPVTRSATLTGHDHGGGSIPRLTSFRLPTLLSARNWVSERFKSQFKGKPLSADLLNPIALDWYLYGLITIMALAACRNFKAHPMRTLTLTLPSHIYTSAAHCGCSNSVTLQNPL